MKGRRANLKAKIGIATAAVVGGGAIAAIAVAASSHGGTPVAQSAGYTSSHHAQRYLGQWGTLNSAMSSWGTSPQSSYNMLAGMTTQNGFSQATQHGKTLAVQRGIVVLATSKFLIVQTANGGLHLWLLSGNTKFQNVSATTTGANAMTGNLFAAQQATQSGYMIPAVQLLAGSPLTASQMLTPARAPLTYTVQVAGTKLTVTVTISRGTAWVNQTATTNPFALPAFNPTSFTMPAWTTPTMTTTLARGDLVLVVGTRSHMVLNAQLVLFVPLTTGDVGGAFTPGGGGVKTGTTPGTTTPVPVASSTVGLSGNHS
jgi:hypothetical protein